MPTLPGPPAARTPKKMLSSRSPRRRRTPSPRKADHRRRRAQLPRAPLFDAPASSPARRDPSADANGPSKPLGQPLRASARNASCSAPKRKSKIGLQGSGRRETIGCTAELRGGNRGRRGSRTGNRREPGIGACGRARAGRIVGSTPSRPCGTPPTAPGSRITRTGQPASRTARRHRRQSHVDADGLRVIVNNAGVESENLRSGDAGRLLAHDLETNVVGPRRGDACRDPKLRAAAGGVICNVTSSVAPRTGPVPGCVRPRQGPVSALGESLRPRWRSSGSGSSRSCRADHHDISKRPTGPRRRSSTRSTRAGPRRCGRAVRASAGMYTPAPEAARRIVDAILDDDGPLRYGCDDMTRSHAAKVGARSRGRDDDCCARCSFAFGRRSRDHGIAQPAVRVPTSTRRSPGTARCPGGVRALASGTDGG